MSAGDKAARRGKATPAAPHTWLGAFLRGLALWIVPVILVWMVLTPIYNRVLSRTVENLYGLVESPDVTLLLPMDRHSVNVSRRDFPPSRTNLYRIRVTDLHFPFVLLGAFFLAVPAVPFALRLRRLGWATLVFVLFHLLLLILWVQFVYATQLGEWSAEHYGPFARNAWGLAKHVTDLVVKLALPFVLWAAFYLRNLLPGGPPEAASPAAKRA